LFFSTASSCGSHEKASSSSQLPLRTIYDSTQVKELQSSLYDILLDELLNRLAETQRGKLSSKPPTGDANRINDLEVTDNGDGTFTLTWTYKNLGDYSRDGIVDVGDIAPLAEHFGERKSDGTWAHPVDAAIDGNSDGVIDISDVVPVAENLFNEVDGYRVEGSDSPDGEFIVAEIMPFSSATGEADLRFSFIFQPVFKYYRVVPFDSFSQLGEGSNVVEILASPPPPEQIPPVAALTAVPGWGQAPLRVTLDGSASYDPDGEIVLYEWDFQGDGAFDFSSETETHAEYTFTAPASYSAKLRVTDNDGLSSTASATVIVISSLYHTISGKVIQESGMPIPGVILHLNPGNLVATTDEDGHYEFVRVVNGVYSLSPARENWSFAPEALVITVSEGDVVEQNFSGKWTGTGGRGDWWTWGRDEKHTSESVYLGATASFSFSVDFFEATTDIVEGANGNIFMGSGEKVRAINPQTGEVVWETQLGEQGSISIRSSPCLGEDGTIYVVTEPEGFYALYPDGVVKWRIQIPFTYSSIYDLRSHPVIGKDGTIFTSSPNGNLYAISPDGSVKWLFATGAGIHSSPAVGEDGTVYIGSDDYSLYAVNADGALRWSYKTQGMIISSPAIADDGTVYIGSEDGYLHAVNPDGTLKWKYRTEAVIRYSSPSIASDGTIYIGSWDGYLYAINPDGQLKWKYLLQDALGRISYVTTKPTIGADGAVYLRGGVLGPGAVNRFAVLSADGSILFSQDYSVEVGSAPPITSDRRLYVLVGSIVRWVSP